MHAKTQYTPLTPDEQTFATKHHRIVEQYLRRRRLPIDEWYDVVIFRYLLSVKKWFQRPDLHQWKFSTIAQNDMRSAIGNELRKQSNQIKTISLNTVVPGCEELTLLETVTDKNLNLIYMQGGEPVNISYNVKIPERKRYGVKSDEVLAIESFMQMRNKRNMRFEYDTDEEAKKKIISLRSYRRKQKHQDIYDIFQKDNCIYVMRMEGKDE